MVPFTVSELVHRMPMECQSQMLQYNAHLLLPQVQYRMSTLLVWLLSYTLYGMLLQIPAEHGAGVGVLALDVDALIPGIVEQGEGLGILATAPRHPQHVANLEVGVTAEDEE